MSRPVKRRRVARENAHGVEATASYTAVESEEEEEEGNDWGLEKRYEQKQRKVKPATASKLPIKTLKGWEDQENEDPEEVQSSGSSLESDHGEDLEEKNPIKSKPPRIPHKQQILEAKETLAKLAGLINEEPEEHLGCFKKLGEVSKSNNITVRKLAIAAQCAVFRDQIPGYRIRPHNEDSTEKLTKDVRRLRMFEGALLSSYQAYVKHLDELVRNGNRGPDAASLALIAINCASQLLLGAPHFNFRGELITILVNRVSRKPHNEAFDKCITALEKLFRADIDGRPSLEAVTAITKMVKTRAYRISERLLNTFLQLRLLSEFHHKASQDRVDRDAKPMTRKLKSKLEFRTKRDKKAAKERKVIAKEMEEADAVVSHEERDKMQAETLKLVFATYFRILKERTPQLMGAVLEGLAKYAHLINQDFFGDILEALKELILAAEARAMDDEDADMEMDDADVGAESQDHTARNVARESLLCIITAFALLQGQDVTKSATALHLDLNFFISHLYQTLYPASLNADIEISHKSLHLLDPKGASHSAFDKARSRVNVQTMIVLIIRSLSSTLLPGYAIRSVPPVRVAAFVKQLLTIALQLPENSCLATLGLLQQVSKIHGRKVSALFNTDERRGDGVFNPLSKEVEASNPFATTAWEVELLRRHYSPKVRESVKGMQKTVVAA